jgi:hypothetical protein
LAANCSISPLWIVVFADNSPSEVFSLALDDWLDGAAARIRHLVKIKETWFFPMLLAL